MARKRVPLGEPLPAPDDSEFDYGPEEIEEIKRSWPRHCPRGFERLLEADPEPGA